MKKTIKLKNILFDIKQIQAIKEIEEGMFGGYVLNILISGNWFINTYSKEQDANIDREKLIQMWLK